MDLRRLRAGEWIAGLSGSVLLVSLFLPWREAGTVEASAFEAFAVIDVLILLLAAMAIALLVVTANQKSPAVGIAIDALTTIAGLVVVAVLLVRVPGLDDRASAAWLGLVAAAGVLVGAVVAMRDERMSKAGRWTDSTGVPVDAPPEIETIRSP